MLGARATSSDSNIQYVNDAVSSLSAAHSAIINAASEWADALKATSSSSPPASDVPPEGIDLPGEFDPANFNSAEFQSFSAYVRALHSYAKSVSDAEYLITQYDPENIAWEAAVENLIHPENILPAHFTTNADNWQSLYRTHFGTGSYYDNLFDSANTNVVSAINHASDTDEGISSIFTYVAQGSIYAAAAAAYADQKLTELGGYDWHTNCPAGVGLEVTGGLYGIDWRSKHFNTWPTNYGAFNDSADAGWRVQWNGCGWVASADTALLPQFTSSDSPCEDHLEAANHLFCQAHEEPRDTMCQEVAAAGLCNDGAPHPNLVKALCPVSCGVAAHDCAFDSDAAALDLADIWNLQVADCRELVLQVPYERFVVPVICRFTAIRNDKI